MFKCSQNVIYFRCSDMHGERLEPSVTSNKVASEREYYDDADIAKLLGISVGRLRNKISAGEPLPPRVRPDGCHKRLWPRESVHEWLRQFRGQGVGRRKDGFLPRS